MSKNMSFGLFCNLELRLAMKKIIKLTKKNIPIVAGFETAVTENSRWGGLETTIRS